MTPRPRTRATTSTEPPGLPAIDPRKRSFPPVVDEHVRLIVLGSLPGEESLARGRYYAHPRNQFWALMSGVLGTDLVPLDYEERLGTLLRAHVGLWDTVASATRRGSLDAAIRDHSPNALPELAARLPGLRAFAFNGGRAAAIGREALAGTPLRLIPLPSSSPANTMPFAEKQAVWMTLKDAL